MSEHHSPRLLGILAVLLLSSHHAAAFQSFQSNATTARRFLVNQVNTYEYPYTVHLPDRTTRNLPPLTTPPPLLLSLSGSGARGPGSEAGALSGYDGAGRLIGRYNSGARTAAHLLAAEEFLTVTPICPDDVPQHSASWNTSFLPGIVADVAETYQVDLHRVYLSTYSMGSRAAWDLLMQNPDMFAGAVISSGATYAPQSALAGLIGIPIRNFYGSEDEDGLESATINTMARYNAALAAAHVGNGTGILKSQEIPGADHLQMTDIPFDVTTIVDGYAGALAWLITQRKGQISKIPTLDLAEYGFAADGSPLVPTNASTTATPASTTSAAPTSGINPAGSNTKTDGSIAASGAAARAFGVTTSIVCGAAALMTTLTWW